jgi:hypothetical protein
MNPMEQKTAVVIEKIYSQLIAAKERRSTITYSDCFRCGFGIQYNNKYCHIIQERKGVVNNIPYILGAFARTCNEYGLPPLSSLVVRKNSLKCGVGVVTSLGIKDSVFAEQTDRPNVYQCNIFPYPGTKEASDFLNRVLERLKEKGMAIE